MTDSARYQFGSFVLEPALRRLLRDADEVTLPPKAFDILVLLVRNRERVVSKQELLDAVWADAAVTENTLTQRIKQLREALGDDPKEPRYVKTISRVGYRFVGEVTEAAPRPTDIAKGESVERVAGDVTPPGVPTAVPGTTDANIRRPLARPRAIAVLTITVVLSLAAAGIWLGTTSSRETPREARHLLVSSFGGSHRSASLSPDAQMMAFVMEAEGIPQVWIKSISSGSPVQLTHGDVPAGRPRWSPRSDQIVFERRDRGIWSVPPLGGEARQIIEVGHSPNFSRDGSVLVYEVGRTGVQPLRWGIWRAGADGSEPRRVEGTPEKHNWAAPSFPALSPDGTWIAFFRHTEGPRGDTWIVRAAGGDARAITADDREGGAPVWTTDSRSVIFSSARRGSRTLWKIPIDGALIEQVTTGAGADDEPDLSLDGRVLIYTTYRDRYALAVWDRRTNERRAVVSRPLPFVLPDVSPAGDRIAFFQQTGGDVHVFVSTPDGQTVTQLTFGSGEENVHPSWSPDGRFVYYHRLKPDRRWRRIGVDGRGDTEVLKDWRWASVFVERNPTATHAEWWRIEVSTGREEALGTIGPFYPPSPNVDVLPDGRVVYSEFEPGPRELWIRDGR